MKIIFLDIDGVLNVMMPERDKFGSLFHPHFVENLRRLINETGAKIVISSTWRFDGLDAMIEMWQERNLPGEVIGITPDCQYIVNEIGKYEFYDQVQRGDEVKAWLEHAKSQNIIIDNYIIIDDDNDFLPEQMNNFVRTANNKHHEDCIDIGYGLTKICSEKAIQILNI